MRKFCTSDLSFALSRRSACAIASSCPLPRRTPSPPRSAARLSVPAASLRPLLLLGRRHGHHHRQCRPHHRHHRCRCHHHHNLWWRGACITCTLSRHSSCLVATTTSSFSSTGAARCAPPPRLSSPSLLPLPRSSRSSRCLLLCWHAHALCFSHAGTHGPDTGRGLLLHARSSWQLGWRVTSGKFRSGLLPQFQHQLRALLFGAMCVVCCWCPLLYTV